MSIPLWPNVHYKSTLGRDIVSMLEHYPDKSVIYITSADDGDHGVSSYHYGLSGVMGYGEAIDIGAGGVTPTGVPRMRAVAEWLYQFSSSTIELIHNNGDGTGFYVKNGRRVTAYAADAHLNHVHIALTVQGLAEINAALAPVPPPPAVVPPRRRPVALRYI